MWIDYAIYLTTAVVLLSVAGLVLILATGWGTWVSTVVTVGFLLAGLAGTFLLRPENFRSEIGSELTVLEVGDNLEAHVDSIGLCLSVFRRVGPLSFNMGNDLYPGDDWDRQPMSSCELMEILDGTITLPDSVRSGDWMLCDYSACYAIANET